MARNRKTSRRPLRRTQKRTDRRTPIPTRAEAIQAELDGILRFLERLESLGAAHGGEWAERMRDYYTERAQMLRELAEDF